MASSATTKPPTLAAALLAAQQAAPVIPKTEESSAFGGKAHHYVGLDSLLKLILPVLNEHGLALVQHPTTIDGQPALETKLIHAATGEAESSLMLLLLAKQDPQGQGSAITYARRYALMAALGLSADEDDDGARASNGGRLAEGEVGASDAARADRPITENQRKVIYGKARGYDIDKEWIPRIIAYSTLGRLRSADDVQTNGQLDHALGQLLAFSKDPGAAMAAIEAWEGSGEATAAQAELPPDPPPASDFTGSDEDILF